MNDYLKKTKKKPQAILLVVFKREGKKVRKHFSSLKEENKDGGLQDYIQFSHSFLASDLLYFRILDALADFF